MKGIALDSCCALLDVQNEWEARDKTEALSVMQSALNCIESAASTMDSGKENVAMLNYIKNVGKKHPDFQAVIDDIDSKKHLRYNKRNRKYYVEVRYEKPWYKILGIQLKGDAKKHLFIKTSMYEDETEATCLKTSILLTHKSILAHLYLLFQSIKQDFNNAHLFIPFPSFNTNLQLKCDYFNSKCEIEAFYSVNKRPYNGNKRQRYNSNLMDYDNQLPSNKSIDEKETDDESNSTKHKHNNSENKSENKSESKSKSKNKCKNRDKYLHRLFKQCMDDFLNQGLDEAEAREMAKIEMLDKHQFQISPEKQPPPAEPDPRVLALLNEQPEWNDNDW